MKRYFIILFFLLAGFKYIFGQPNYDYYESVSPRDLTEGNDCFQIVWSFEDGEQYFHDCKIYNPPILWIYKLIKVDCGFICTTVYDVYINGNHIETLSGNKFYDGEIGTFNIQKYLDQEGEKGKSIAEIKIRVRTSCLDDFRDYNEYTVSRIVYLVGKGDKYYSYTIVENDLPPGLNFCENGKNSELYMKTRTCCSRDGQAGGDKTISMGIDIKTITSTGHPGQVSLNLGYSFKGISLGGSYSYVLPSQFASNDYTNSIQSTVTIHAPKEKNKCNYAAIFVEYDHIIQNSYINDCDANTKDKWVGRQDFYLPINFSLIECSDFATCSQKVKLYRSKTNINNRSDCNGTLIVESIPSNNTLTYQWTLPDGSLSDGSNTLDMNQPGLYTCIVIDECCNKFELQYNNCDKTTYGPWKYDR